MDVNSHPTKARIISIYGKDPENLGELAECIIAVENANFAGTNRVVGFSWTLSHGDVSNSHRCPLNGVTCWSSQQAADGRPRNYPGWNGRVWIRYENATTGRLMSLLDRTCSYIGTGGGGGYGGPWENINSAAYRDYEQKGRVGPGTFPHIFSWDYRIYDSDWPEMANFYQEERMVAKLKNNSIGQVQHRFLWEDPVVKLTDEKFIKSLENVKRTA